MNTPPKLPLIILRWFCDPRLLTYIEGDLIELFQEREAKGNTRKANWLLFIDVIKLFRPGIIRSFEGDHTLNQYGMFKNYLKIGIRNMLRHKSFSVLNILGLSIGVACSVLISLYVYNEYSYDKYNEKYDRIYRVLNGYGNADLPETFEYQVWGCAPVGPALKEEFPEIETFFRFTSPSSFLVEYESKVFQEENLVFADSTAFQVFDWKLLQGNPKTALTRPNTIVLTQTMASKYFGNENPLGKVLIVDTEDPIEVTGIMEDIPANSHFSFDGMVSMATFQNARPGIFESWGYVDFYTYFTVSPNATIDVIIDKESEVLKKYAGAARDYYKYKIEPLSDAYLYSEAARQPGATGNLANIYIFITVAIFVVFIACVNFMNLSTARAVERAKEVAIRKTIGSVRSSLIIQFLVEALLMVTFSFVLAAVLVVFSLPYLELLSGKSLAVDWLFSWQNGVWFLIGVIVVGFLSGSYPAFVLSGFKPSSVLKGSFKTSSSGTTLRKTLVVFQFALSIMLLVGTVVVYAQLDFVRNHQLGYNSSQMLVIDFGWDRKVQQHVKYIKNELNLVNGVEAVSVTRAVPGTFFPNAGTTIESPSGEMITRSPALYEVDEDFIPTYEMEMAAGRNYSMEYATDSLTSLIVNEAAARQFGYGNPADIVGKRFQQWGREGKVIGLVKDFNYVSLHDEVEPLALRYATINNSSMISLRLQSDDLRQTVSAIEDRWNELAPHRPFMSTFLDQNFNDQYQADEQFGIVFGVFSGLAIFIACLGLLGLTIYSTVQRSKEIGIRKVMGASILQIITLLSLDFVKLFLIAFVLAVPVSWYIMNAWLEDFAYRMNLGWEVYFIAGTITFLVAFLSVWVKAFGAARANPVVSLKDE